MIKKKPPHKFWGIRKRSKLCEELVERDSKEIDKGGVIDVCASKTCKCIIIILVFSEVWRKEKKEIGETTTGGQTNKKEKKKKMNSKTRRQGLFYSNLGCALMIAEVLKLHRLRLGSAPV
jgi:hypothetical protein